jgi:hypothetical protein
MHLMVHLSVCPSFAAGMAGTRAGDALSTSTPGARRQARPPISVHRTFLCVVHEQGRPFPRGAPVNTGDGFGSVYLFVNTHNQPPLPESSAPPLEDRQTDSGSAPQVALMASVFL